MNHSALLFVCILLAGGPALGDTGPITLPPAPGPDPKPAVAPDGWKVETVLRAPQIESPSVVCALPDGRVLVAEDPLDNRGGKEPIDRILCLFPDGRVTVWAEKLYPVFGLAYLDGKVFVHQFPRYTVFTDDAEAGIGKDPFTIIDHTGKPTIGGLNDHIPAQIRLAMDGYFYMSIGDRGVFGAKSVVDGREADLQGGGLLRIRPDGTGMEVFSTGTRNHLDVSLNAEDEMFTYDNTDDGLGWWTRFTHMVDGGFYGYPWDYRPPANKDDRESRKLPKDYDKDHPYQPYTLWRMAEYGGGSPCGAVAYNEDALPEQYRGNLFHCEWGKGKVQRFVVERAGATFKVAEMEDFLKPGGDMRPLGIDVTADGLGFYVTDWGYGGWHQKKENVGRLLKVTWTGKSHATPRPAWYVPAAMGKPFKATTAELAEALKHPARSVRVVAQRRLSERGREAVVRLVDHLLLDKNAPPHAVWHAIWALDRIDGGASARSGIGSLANEAKDPSVRRQALRQLAASRAKNAWQVPAFSLDDPDASVRFHAATALGRMGDARAVPAILAKLGEKDLFTRFALFTALNRIGRADPAAWPAIVKGLRSDKPDVRANTAYALRNTFEEALVGALSRLAHDVSASTAARSAALLAVAELHRSTKPWEGKWWGTQPAGSPRPPKVVEWSGTPVVLDTIRRALDDGDAAIRQAAVEAMRIAPDPAAADVLVALFRKDPSVEVRKSVLQALAAAKSPSAAPLVGEVLGEPEKQQDLVPDAIALAEQVGGKPAVEALNRFVQAQPRAEVAVPALQALGRLKDPSSAPVVAEQVRSQNVQVATAAATALSRIGGKAAAPPLVAALSDARPEVRKAAVAGLGSLKAAEAVPALIKAWRDPQTNAEAVTALASMPTLEALDVYLDAVGGKDAALREVSKKALTAIREQAKPLIEAKLEQGLLPPGALTQLQSLYGTFEPVAAWWALGPFDRDAPPPLDPAKLETPAASGDFKGADGKPVTWRKVRGSGEHGMIDLARVFDPNQNAAAYLVAEITAAAGREVELHFGSDDRHAVWLNGEKIAADSGNSGWNHEEDKAHATLRAGRNLLVVRSENDGGPWQFSASLSGERKGKLFEPIAGKKPDRQAYAAYALSEPGDVKKGEKLFRSDNLACFKCHQVGSEGGQVGPSLTGIGAKYDRSKLIESVLEPSRQIFDGYQQTVIRTQDGDVQAGVVRAETDAEVTLFDSAAQPHVIRKADIASRKVSEMSVMPEGLEQGMTQQELADLVSYLESQKEAPK